MDLLIATGSVPLEQRDIAPTSGTPQWATDGNPATGVPATDWPAWMFNMLLAEMINVVDKAGLGRSLTDWTQLYQAIMSLVGKGRFINQQRFIVSGTYVPTVGARIARIRGVGAGGPGGYAQPNSTNGYKSAAGGGGSGAECDLWIDVSSVSSLPVTIGAPASAIASEEQNSGGDSWFGNYLVTLGAGQGGGPGVSVSSSSGTMTTGSAGGEVSIGAAGNFLYPPIIKGGASGAVGTVIFGVNVPGFGAPSSYGTPGQISSNGNGGAGGYWGAGGGGGGSSSATGNIGGAGCGAIFIIDEYS